MNPISNNNNSMVPIAPAMPNSNHSPPSSDIHRKKRTRAKRSCDMCRKKKTRCDADVSRPCTKCKLNNEECQFLVEQKKRGPSTGSYVEVLENRLLRLEKLLQTISKEKQGVIAHTSCTNGVNVAVDNAEIEEEVEEEETQEEENKEETGYDDAPKIRCPSMLSSLEFTAMEEQMTKLTINDYQRTRYIGASSGVHFLNEEIFRTNKKHRLPEEPSWFIQKLNDDEDEHIIMKTKAVSKQAEYNPVINKLDIFEDISFMTKEVVDYLIHMYFTRVHIYCPIINKVQFLEQYYLHLPTAPDKYLLYAILTISISLFITENDNNTFGFTSEQFRNMYAVLKTKSHKLLSVVYHRSMISTVQALMLLGMFLGNDENDDEDTSHWFITGMAIRMAQDLGLHRDCSKWNIPDYEIELRKRLWYACYMMDRWVAADLGRPVSILDHEFDVELPTCYELNYTSKLAQHVEIPILIMEAEYALGQQKTVYSCFVYLVTLSQIAGEVLIGFHSTRAKHNPVDNVSLLHVLDKNLTNWKLTLPKELQLTNLDHFYAPASVVNMACDCVLYSFSQSFIKLNTNQNEENNNLAFKALSICTASAANLVGIIEAMERHSFIALPWNMAIYGLFQASIIFLHNAKGENKFIKEQGKRYLNRCAKVYNHDPYLSKTRVVKILQELIKQFEVTMESQDGLDFKGANDRKRKGDSEEIEPFQVHRFTHPILPSSAKNVCLTTTIQQQPESTTNSQCKVPDPFTAHVNNDMTSTKPEDVFYSSLSFGLGKSTMNAMFQLQQQQQQEDTARRNKMASMGEIVCPPTGADIICPSMAQCPTMNVEQPHNCSSNESFNTTPETINHLLLDQQNFDIASLNSQLPLWELPSGVTWIEWESFLKTCTS